MIIREKFFSKSSGEYFTAIEASDYNLFNRFQNDEDIIPVLQQRRDIGKTNMLRVWTLFNLVSIGVCTSPQYEKLDAFCKLCAKYGQYVEFTAYTDIWDSTHYPKLIEATAKNTNVIIEMLNEGHMYEETKIFSKSPYHLTSRGSGLSEQLPMLPLMDYGTVHFNSAYEWWRKNGHNAMELANDYGKPILTNESTRSDDNDNNPNHYGDSSFAVAALNAGSCFHSIHGKNSTLWQGREEECAHQHGLRASEVDLIYQDGQYIRLEPNGLLRYYLKRLDGHPDLDIQIRY